MSTAQLTTVIHVRMTRINEAIIGRTSRPFTLTSLPDDGKVLQFWFGHVHSLFASLPPCDTKQSYTQ